MSVRTSFPLLTLLATVWAASPVDAQTVVVPATVSAITNIYGAGLASPLASSSACGPASNGVAPVAIAIPAGATRFTVNGVTGSVFCAVGNSTTSGDGPCIAASTNISGENFLSGIVSNGTNMYIAGTFLGDGLPAPPAPGNLVFNTTDFTSLAPALQQVFFIGDGLTGTGTGTVQQFQIPSGASRLYLGFADAFSFAGSSGCYADNSGSLGANVVFAGFPPTAVPGYSRLGLGVIAMLLAFAGLASARKRRAHIGRVG